MIGKKACQQGRNQFRSVAAKRLPRLEVRHAAPSNETRAQHIDYAFLDEFLQ